MKIAVAMSGGVDSSVAAALLRKEGYEVLGVTAQIWPRDKSGGNGHGCCGNDAVTDAKKVAYKLGIPHYVMNFREVFAEKVINHFCQEYSRGRTPNPCIQCNRYVKFAALLERARELGADFIATGHYARIETDEATRRHFLKKGADPQKDQSYFLYALTQEQLAHTLFPAGDFTKDKIREIAREMELPVAARAESQEICFIPDDDYPAFLKDRIPQAASPGPIINELGNILGQHKGIMFYTIGQRKGLGIAAREPRYVIAIEPERNAIVVGDKEAAYGSELIATNLNWITLPELEASIKVKAKVRYRHPEAEATVTPLPEDRVCVSFNEPQMALTPGQAVVFHNGDTIIGGGTIEETRN